MKIAIALAIAAAALATAGAASAETGAQPHMDQLCTHPAFAAVGPASALQGGEFTGVTLVGLRSQNAYCASSDFKHPADYGSAPERP